MRKLSLSPFLSVLSHSHTYTHTHYSLTHSLTPDNNFETEFDPKRGWDHGVFIPLKLIYPDADIPLVQLSLNVHLDPEYHYRLGQLLGPLRDEGVMILGSGQATHNMRELMHHMTFSPFGPAVEFVSWLNDLVRNPSAEERHSLLNAWKKAPEGVRNHPREGTNPTTCLQSFFLPIHSCTLLSFFHLSSPLLFFFLPQISLTLRALDPPHGCGRCGAQRPRRKGFVRRSCWRHGSPVVRL